ncbi:hypothetical protein B9Z55_024701 [Caenorhabditis nigoni]|uniref:Uncharacterized protein n=2 Tax=Caenorhabditis nigoni TaxID=1611254 RepID=A0A2G5SVR7_9PELO|nr:hypothetical protein B9Z55_024701 [Caenorhabditis nigoni]
MDMNRPWKPTNVDILAVDPSLYYRYRYPDDAMIHTPPAERRAAQNNDRGAVNVVEEINIAVAPAVENERIAEEPVEIDEGTRAVNEPIENVPTNTHSQRSYWFCNIL